ncbi:MAG: hypothetical protein LBS39_03000 [Campylobacteraceae bacterium]|nr:hypothetical protein [Campylobacteraceae bacterium]
MLITFNKLTAYKDKIEIDEKFFGVSIIKMNEIKLSVAIGSYILNPKTVLLIILDI